jgi:hypothetical protein
MTISDVLVGAAITGILLTALVTGSVMLQKQFATATQYAESQGDQIRAMDFIEMDARRATAVTIGSGATPLTVTIPNYYQTVGGRKQPILPTKSGVNVQYGTGSVNVTYTLQGTNLIRTEGTVATTIATTVKSFPPPVRTGNYLTSTLTFDVNWKRAATATAQTVTLSTKSLLRNLH